MIRSFEELQLSAGGGLPGHEREGRHQGSGGGGVGGHWFAPPEAVKLRVKTLSNAKAKRVFLSSCSKEN